MTAAGQPVQPTQIVLHRDAPWNRNNLPRGGWHNYAQHGDRRFHAEGPGVYTIHEVGMDGLPLGWETAKTLYGLDTDRYDKILDGTWVGVAFNRGGIRVAIAAFLNGATRDEINEAVRVHGHPGTGRNSATNTARRRSN